MKLRTVITQLLKPRFLYACSAERILFYDNAWRGLDAGEFKQVTTFMTLEEMKLKVEQQKKISSSKEISIDTTIAGGFDPTVGKERKKDKKKEREQRNLEMSTLEIGALGRNLRNGENFVRRHKSTCQKCQM